VKQRGRVQSIWVNLSGEEEGLIYTRSKVPRMASIQLRRGKRQQSERGRIQTTTLKLDYSECSRNS
jgi:hypothetical protein